MLKYLLEKEFKQFLRNAFLPRLVVLFPVMVMLVIPWIATMDIKDIRLAVVDSDRSASSGRLVRDMAASSCFILEDVCDSYDAALKKIERGRADAIVEIPSGFEKNLMTEGTTPVQLSINAVNGTRGILGSSYLGAVMADFPPSAAPPSAAPPAPPSAAPPSAAPPSAAPPSALQQTAPLPRVDITVQNRYNPLLDYKLFMIPALMIILLIVMCGFLPTLNIVSEKERGTIEQMNVTPVSKFTFIIAKLIPYWLMGMLILTVCMALAYVVYGLYPRGNVLVIYLFSFLFVLSMSGLGLVVSNHSNTMQQAMFVMFFFVMIFQLMSGLLTPIRSMPEWAQWITVFNPPRYFIRMMRLIYLKGGSLTDLAADFLALLGFVVFFGLWAVASYRKRE
ncbi:MAG: ABC transporter permease [Tannerella sp.]|nr:ABC transporter permease [Tannerella sp.]